MKVPRGNKSAAATQNGGGSSRFLCFKPTAVGIDHANDTFLFLSEKQTRKVDFHEEKGSRGRRFTRAVLASLFHHKSKVRNPETRIGRNESLRCDSKCSFRFPKHNHVVDRDPKPMLPKSSSMRSTSSSSSSCPSSQSSESPSEPNSNPNPKPQKQSIRREHSSRREQSRRKEQNSWSSSFIAGIVLVMLSLTVTIFFGKMWAIGLSVIYLYSIRSTRRPSEIEDSNGGKELERVESSREQKRRVIMEGLLDRRHFHHHLHHPNFHQQ